MSCISSIRSELFLDAKESGLDAGGDALVTRRKTNGGKTVRGKHASDICQLVSSIKNKTVIPEGNGLKKNSLLVKPDTKMYLKSQICPEILLIIFLNQPLIK